MACSWKRRKAPFQWPICMLSSTARKLATTTTVVNTKQTELKLKQILMNKCIYVDYYLFNNLQGEQYCWHPLIINWRRRASFIVLIGWTWGDTVSSWERSRLNRKAGWCERCNCDGSWWLKQGRNVVCIWTLPLQKPMDTYRRGMWCHCPGSIRVLTLHGMVGRELGFGCVTHAHWLAKYHHFGDPPARAWGATWAIAAQRPLIFASSHFLFLAFEKRPKLKLWIWKNPGLSTFNKKKNPE